MSAPDPGFELVEGTLRLRTGDRLDRFLVLDDLGGSLRPVGGTRHAVEVHAGIEVALRLEPMPEESLDDFLAAYDMARRQALREVTLPGMIWAGWSQGIGWVATHWVHGVDGRDLANSGVMTPALVASIFLDLALALSELHGHGLVHGDICPWNLRLDPEGKLALVGHLPVPHGASTPALSPSGERVRFAAPERFPEGPPTPTGDVFTLGMTAWALLWGIDSLPATTLEGAGPRLAGLCRDLRESRSFAALPPDLRMALELCLEPDPEVRPQSATQLLLRLEDALHVRAARRDAARARLAADARRVADMIRPRGLAAARRALDEGSPLAAAARLRRAVAPAPPLAGSAELASARDIQREVIWSTFRALDDDDLDEVGLRVAACVLARRAAEGMDSELLASMARRRAVDLAQDAPDGGTLEQHRKSLVAALEEHPSDPNAALLLAVTAPTFEWQPQETASAFRARLMLAAGAQQAGLYYLAQDLSRSPIPRGLAQRIAEVATELADRELAADEAAEEREPPSLEELAGAHVPVVTVPVMNHDQLEEADVEFTRGQVLVREARIGEAAKIFRGLLARGALHQEHFYAAICSELRALMWKALSQKVDEEDHLEAMRVIWDLTRDLELDTLQPLAARLWLGALRPGPGRLAKIEELLELSPRSVILRQAAVQEARTLGEEELWAQHLVEAGFLFLERMDLEAASRMFMGAKAVVADGRVEEGMVQVFQAGIQVARAAQKLRELEEILANDPGPPAEDFRRVREFLREFPYYRPAAERIVELARDDGRPLPASLAHMRLAQDAFLRGRDMEARRHLRDILSIEYGNDEALLYLASLDPPGLGAPEDVPLLRVWLLRREALHEAARYRARRELRDGPEDRPYLDLLAGICEDLGDDPTPYLVALCVQDLREGKVEEGREKLREALGYAPEPGEAVRQFLDVPEIWQAFRPWDLIPDMAEEA